MFSPNRRQFFVITRRGDLALDCNVYELKVFELQAVRAALDAKSAPPRPSVWSTCSKDSLEAGISSVRWAEDSRALVFLEARESRPRQVVFWNPNSQEGRTLTTASFNVDSFDYRAGAIVYVAAVNTGRRSDWSGYPVSSVRAPELTAALGYAAPSYVIYARAPNGDVHPVTAPQSGDWRRVGFLSPDGKKAVIVDFLTRTRSPSAWAQYKNSAGKSFTDYAQYRILDVRSGESRQIVDAPLGHAIDNHTRPQVLWSPDSKRVILVNTLLPISKGNEQRIRTSFVVDYDVSKDEPRIVGALPAESMDRIRPGFAPVMDVRWLREGRELLVSGMAPSVTYRLTSGGWVQRPRAAAVTATGKPTTRGFDVSIRQDLSQPPALIASEARL